MMDDVTLDALDALARRQQGLVTGGQRAMLRLGTLVRDVREQMGLTQTGLVVA
ncbi:MAG: hypothetical protein ACRDWW_04150 [Acidimicrobiales bacterium]